VGSERCWGEWDFVYVFFFVAGRIRLSALECWAGVFLFLCFCLFFELNGWVRGRDGFLWFVLVFIVFGFFFFCGGSWRDVRCWVIWSNKLRGRGRVLDGRKGSEREDVCGYWGNVKFCVGGRGHELFCFVLWLWGWWFAVGL